MRGDYSDTRRRTIGKMLITAGVVLFIACLCMLGIDTLATQQAQGQVIPPPVHGLPPLFPSSTATRPSGSPIAVGPPGTPTAPATAVSSDQVSARLFLSWQTYKRDYIQRDGRVIDHARGAVSTSEGQSYALLRSVWMHDRSTFNKVWFWTQHNLQVRNDALLGYLWGRHSDGSWSVLDTDSATDADEDTATALLFAARLWHSPAYRSAARAIIRDIWRHEVVTVGGRPYLTAGNWAILATKPGPTLNPSYFAPYEYRLFAVADTAHPWMAVVDSSYRALFACSAKPLDVVHSANLPPDWCALTDSKGLVAPVHNASLDTLYGYDAFRTMWRTALDYEWNKEPRAKAYLDGSDFLRKQWTRSGKLLNRYRHDGSVDQPAEDLTVYGGDIGAFAFSDRTTAEAIVQQKLLASFAELPDGTAYWDRRNSYYEQNWVWFGVALFYHRLPDIAR